MTDLHFLPSQFISEIKTNQSKYFVVSPVKQITEYSKGDEIKIKNLERDRDLSRRVHESVSLRLK